MILGFLRWCEMDFAHQYDQMGVLIELPLVDVVVVRLTGDAWRRKRKAATETSSWVLFGFASPEFIFCLESP